MRRDLPTRRANDTDETEDAIICRLCGKAFKMIAWWHLTRKHGLDPLTAVPEYKRRFRLRSTLCAASEKRRLRNYLQSLDSANRLWTKESVVAVLREYSRGETLSPADFPPKRYKSIATIARRVFGTWPAALLACGLKPLRAAATRWTRAEVIRRIRRRKLRGLPLSQTDVKQSEPALYAMASIVMKKPWSFIVQNLGMRGRRIRWGKEMLRKEISHWRRFGRARLPGVTNFSIHMAARRHYGSWSLALKAAAA